MIPEWKTVIARATEMLETTPSRLNANSREVALIVLSLDAEMNRRISALETWIEQRTKRHGEP